VKHLLLSSLKNYETVEFENFPHTALFWHVAIIIRDPWLSQGLTVDEKCATLQGTTV
jgi:hypothetical protein